MAQVSFARRAQADLERLFEFLLAQDPRLAKEAVAEILDADAVLERHPLVGRPAESDLRELVISRGRAGYVALYYFDPARDVVQVLSVRHQRQSGFRE